MLFIFNQGFLNYGSVPQIGLPSKTLQSRDFNGLQDRVAVVQLLSCRTEWLWYVVLSFIKKFNRRRHFDYFLFKVKTKHFKLDLF